MPERETSAARYCEVRGQTEAIAAPLSAEDQTAQSMPDVSPTKWHRAHTTWFFEEFLLAPQAARYEPFHPGFSYLFNSYYEGVGPRHARHERGSVTRPGVEETAQYRRHVDGAMLDLLRSGVEPEVGALVELGLHHEQQHQELALMDIKHVLSRNSLDPAYLDITRSESAAEPLHWTPVDGGLDEIGAPGDGFCFDNEQPRHQVYVDPFELASRPVTAGEVLAFIDDDGYHRAELWLSDGWATVQSQGWEAPLYWDQQDGEAWTVFTLSGRRPVDPNEPACHLSYYEADAIARWLDARLPTEAEWEVAAQHQPVSGNLLDLQVLHPGAPTAPTTSPHERLFGDVWEWTSSAYLPYPRFAPAPGAVGEYNGKFMVNQHVLKGGSCVTPLGHIRPSYRNFFPPAARWAFSGARLARDLEL